jgi:hypothetical protein
MCVCVFERATHRSPQQMASQSGFMHTVPSTSTQSHAAPSTLHPTPYSPPSTLSSALHSPSSPPHSTPATEESTTQGNPGLHTPASARRSSFVACGACSQSPTASGNLCVDLPSTRPDINCAAKRLRQAPAAGCSLSPLLSGALLSPLSSGVLPCAPEAAAGVQCSPRPRHSLCRSSGWGRAGAGSCARAAAGTPTRKAPAFEKKAALWSAMATTRNALIPALFRRQPRETRAQPWRAYS